MEYLEFVWRVFAILSLLVSLGAATAVYMNSPGRKIEKSIDTLSAAVETQKKETLEALKGHDRRIQAVEDEVKHLPTSDEFNQLQVTVTRLEGHVERVEEMVTWVKSTVQSMDNYLRAKQ